MATGIECLQYTPKTKNDNFFPYGCFILDKNGKYIGVHISNIKYMQNETENYRI